VAPTAAKGASHHDSFWQPRSAAKPAWDLAILAVPTEAAGSPNTGD
jgi:hypothetical protein